jgi:rare lipoprotein A (peptidoglycan hydrolase)
MSQSHSRPHAERTEANKDASRENHSTNLGQSVFSPDQRQWWSQLFAHHDAMKAQHAGSLPTVHADVPHVSAGQPKHTEGRLDSLFAMVNQRGDKSPAGGHGKVENYYAGKTQHYHDQVAPRGHQHNLVAPATDNVKHGKHGGSGKGEHGGVMSFYHEPQMMANGHRFNPEAYTVASKTLKLGSVVDIHSHGKTIRATVTDRGPYYGNRSLDVSKRIAREFGFTNAGTAHYTMDVVSTPNGSGHHRRHYQA